MLGEDQRQGVAHAVLQAENKTEARPKGVGSPNSIRGGTSPAGQPAHRIPSEPLRQRISGQRTQHLEPSQDPSYRCPHLRLDRTRTNDAGYDRFVFVFSFSENEKEFVTQAIYYDNGGRYYLLATTPDFDESLPGVVDW